jgi:hypothetical protein
VTACYAATATECADVPALRTERDRARARLDDLAAMFADEDITRTEYTAMRRRVTERIERVEHDLARRHPNLAGGRVGDEHGPGRRVARRGPRREAGDHQRSRCCRSDPGVARSTRPP